MSKNNDESEPVSRVWVDPDWISRNEYRALVAQMDAAYRERNQLVALLAGLFPSSLERHPDEDTEWEDDWRWICFIDFPGFQATWHLQDAELPLFDHVPRLQGRSWDGHTTEEKYARIAAYLHRRDDTTDVMLTLPPGYRLLDSPIAEGTIPPEREGES